MRVLNTRHQKIECVAFSADGAHLFASGLHAGSLGHGQKDSGIDVFDLAGGSDPAAHLLAVHDISWLAAVPGSRLAVNHFGSADNGGSRGRAVSVLDWKADSSIRLRKRNCRVDGPFAIHPDGDRLIAGLDSPLVGSSTGPPGYEQGIGCWAVPAAGTPRIAWQVNLGYGRQLLGTSYGQEGRSFWTAEQVESRTVPYSWIEFVPRDAETGNSTGAAVAYPNQYISGLALSPNGRFAVAHDGASLFVYDLAKLDRKPKRVTNPAKRKRFGGFAIYPSGNWLAAAGLDGAVTLWDTATWKVARSWVWGVDQARSVCFSTDGTLAASGTSDGKVVVWDLDL